MGTAERIALFSQRTYPHILMGKASRNLGGDWIRKIEGKSAKILMTIVGLLRARALRKPVF